MWSHNEGTGNGKGMTLQLGFCDQEFRDYGPYDYIITAIINLYIRILAKGMAS